MRRTNAIRTSLLTMLALMAGAFAAFAPSASASSFTTSSYASRLLSLVNGARADHGLPALRSASGTTTVAANWTAHMAGAGVLAHNPDLRHQIETHGSPDWTTYGENVGQGASRDPDSLFDAYMRSPEHRANILTGAYRYVGVAVVFDGATSWNTFDFVDAYGTPTTTTQPVQKRPAVHHRTQAAKPSTQPAASPAPVSAPVATPAHKPAADRPRHQHAAQHQQAAAHKPAARDHRVEVRGIRTTATQPLRGVVATDASFAQPLTPLPANRSSRAVLVAVAVLALAAAARRWTLTVAHV